MTNEIDPTWSSYANDPQGLAVRNDLENAVGIIVGQPEHFKDDDGTIHWGSWPEGGPYGTEPVYQLLEREILAAIEDVRSETPNLPEFDRIRPTHLYDYPPAAQGIPEIAAMLWEQGYPLLDYAEKGYLTGKFVRAVIERFRQRTSEPMPHPSAEGDTDNKLDKVELPGWAQPRITLTQGSIVALIIAKIVDAFGYQENLEIHSHARGILESHSPSHPDPQLTYLVRVAFSGNQYGYVVDAQGEVIEYFQVKPEEFVSLPTPNLFGNDSEEGGIGRGPLDHKMRVQTKTE